MKRYGSLFSKITSWENLVLAARRAARAKPMSLAKMAFEFNMERELVCLRKELTKGIYRPGPYRTFIIHDPKERLISAAPYRDRVVHHALCNIIEPLFDRSFLPQNYANRKGRGLHMAVKAGSRIVNSSVYILKGDIRKYFPSIDHRILKEKIRRKIKCRPTLELISLIIDNSNEQEDVIFYFPGDNMFTPLERRKGLPIGNLTSQLFANIYLDGFDHFVVQHLKIKRYARYVDDCVLGSDSKEHLHVAFEKITRFMQVIRLKLHERKTVVFPAKRGMTFLGFRLYPGKVLAGKRCGKRFKARLKQMQKEYARGDIDLRGIKQVIASYNGHLAHGATKKLRSGILNGFPFVKASHG